MLTQTPMGLEPLENAIKYESARVKHGREIVDRAINLVRTSLHTFDSALEMLIRARDRGERLPRAIVADYNDTARKYIESKAIGNRHERRKAARLARSRR